MADESTKRVVLAGGCVVPAGILRFRFDRSAGPGGQNVNKLNTRATLTVRLDDLAAYLPAAAMGRLRLLAGHWLASDRLVITDASSRSQRANRQACIDRLKRVTTAAMVQPKKRRPTRPSRSAVERRLKQKKRRSEIKRMRTRRPGAE